MPSEPLSACAELVRRHDPDRFLTALFAPPAMRETLFVLYAVNHELARAREVVSGGAGVEAGVDAAEQHAESRRDHIRNALAVRCRKLGGARSAG